MVLKKRGEKIMKKNWKNFYATYRHAIPLLIYGVIYLAWFRYLEVNTPAHYQLIHVAADDYIPFCEAFVIPYFLWFAYVAATVVFFFFKNKEDYYKTCVFLFTGMTIFLIVSTFWPNGHHLRPTVMPRNNVFTSLLGVLYKADTPTNLWPSIHVYNSLGAHFAIVKSKAFEKRRGIRIGSLALSSSIIASTMLIKQHSVFDVVTAFVMAAVMYTVVYHYDIVLMIQMARNKKKARPQIS